MTSPHRPVARRRVTVGLFGEFAGTLLPVSEGFFQFGHPDRDPLAQREGGFLGFEVEQLGA